MDEFELIQEILRLVAIDKNIQDHYSSNEINEFAIYGNSKVVGIQNNTGEIINLKGGEMYIVIGKNTLIDALGLLMRLVEKEIEVLKYCCVGWENMSVDLRTANFSYCPHCGKKIK